MIGSRPPDPDHVAPRGTDAYNDAVNVLHKWVAKNLARGMPMDQLVDKYDDFGNISHDWKEWNNWGGGFQRPAEWDEEMWNIGNFQRQAQAGDFTEWPPGSGIYFNDPSNDQMSRQFYNQYGDQIGQPNNFDIPFDIDYGAVNSGYGGNIRKYLEDETKHRTDAAKAPKDIANGVYNRPVASVSSSSSSPQPTNNITHGAWGVTNFATGGGGNNNPSAKKDTIGLPQPMAGPMAINPFRRDSNQSRPFSQPQGYQVWRR